MPRTLSKSLIRFDERKGLKGLGYDPDAGYYPAVSDSANDVGTGFSGSSLWSGFLDLGKTYLQTEAQKKMAQQLSAQTLQPGSTVQVSGGVVTRTAAPVTYAAPSVLDGIIKNPLTWVAGGLLALKLFKKK